jgi:predicted RNase H-like HicB family nuclease
MQYNIFIQNPTENHFTASVIGVPDCVAIGKTKAEALANVKSALEEQLAQGEIVTLDLQLPVSSAELSQNPLMKFAGMWANDPTFDDFVAEMKKMREEEAREEAEQAAANLV